MAPIDFRKKLLKFLYDSYPHYVGPEEVVDFLAGDEFKDISRDEWEKNIWYLVEKGYIKRHPMGYLRITVQGIDYIKPEE